MLRREDKRDAVCLREVFLDMRISVREWSWPRARPWLQRGPERVGLRRSNKARGALVRCRGGTWVGTPPVRRGWTLPVAGAGSQHRTSTAKRRLAGAFRSFDRQVRSRTPRTTALVSRGPGDAGSHPPRIGAGSGLGTGWVIAGRRLERRVHTPKTVTRTLCSGSFFTFLSLLVGQQASHPNLPRRTRGKAGRRSKHRATAVLTHLTVRPGSVRWRGFGGVAPVRPVPVSSPGFCLGAGKSTAARLPPEEPTCKRTLRPVGPVVSRFSGSAVLP